MKRFLVSASHACLVAVNCLALVVCSAQNVEAGRWPVPIADCGVCAACGGTATFCPEPTPASPSLNCTNACECVRTTCFSK